MRRSPLNINELKQALRRENFRDNEVKKATNWLAQGNVGLINRIDREGCKSYELTHEILIPVLKKRSFGNRSR